MQPLVELTESLQKETNNVERSEYYCLILELFLSIEDGKSVCDVTLRDVLVKFDEVMVETMVADLSSSEKSQCYVSILQLAAFCFANIGLWESGRFFSLEALLIRVCETLLDIDPTNIKPDSGEEEVVTTALFALDNNMHQLVEKYSNLFIKAFNHVLKSSSDSNIVRIYAYRSLMRLCRDIVHSPHPSNQDIVGSLASLYAPLSRDLISVNIEVREAVVSFLESLGVSGVKAINACSIEEIRQVLRFLSNRLSSVEKTAAEREVRCSAITWRMLVTMVPSTDLIPLLREGSTDRNTPGVLLHVFNRIYSIDLLEGMKCWKNLVSSLNMIAGWIHRTENVKTLKLILRLLSSTLKNNQNKFFWSKNLTPFTSNISDISIADIKKDNHVIVYIIDTLHLLLEASWPSPERLYSFNFISSSSPSVSGKSHREKNSPETVGQLLQMLMQDQKISSVLVGLFPDCCSDWSSDGVASVSTSVTSTSSASHAVRSSLLLNRIVSLQVGGACSIASSVMQPQGEKAFVPLTAACQSLPLKSLFEWTWNTSADILYSAGEKGGSERKSNLSCGDESAHVSISTFEFLLACLSKAMISLSNIHHEVYQSFKKKSVGCVGACLTNSKSEHDIALCSKSRINFSENQPPKERKLSCCLFQEEIVGYVLSYIESAMKDVIGAWQWATYVFVIQLARGGKLKILEESDTEHQSPSQSMSQLCHHDSENCSGETSATEGPDISFTVNEDGDEEVVVISQDNEAARMVRFVLAHIIQVWKPAWSRSLSLCLPLCRELLLDSFLWLIHKTSTFGISVEDDAGNESCCKNISDVREAVNNEFGASLIPDSMIGALLLLSLSHGLMVDSSENSEFQVWTRRCGFESCRILWKSIILEEKFGDTMSESDSLHRHDTSHHNNSLLAFPNRGRMSLKRRSASMTNFSMECDDANCDNCCCFFEAVGVESIADVHDCSRLSKGLSRCFRGLIETFALPTLAEWLSQVLFCSPFSNRREHFAGKQEVKNEGSVKSVGSRDVLKLNGFSILSPISSINLEATPHKVTTLKQIFRLDKHPLDQFLREPTKHSLAILGAFVSAGVHYLASWKGNDDNCPDDLRRKIAKLVQPFVSFPLTWLLHYSSHDTKLLVNAYAYQHSLKDNASDVGGELRSEVDGRDADAGDGNTGGAERSHSSRISGSKQRSLSFCAESLNLNTQDTSRSTQQLYRILSCKGELDVGKDRIHDLPLNTATKNQSRVLDVVDIALNNHEKFLIDWKFLFSVWLSVVDDSSELNGFIHSSCDGLWNMNNCYLVPQPPSMNQITTPSIASFQIDQFVIDTYVSFSFLNSVYECICVNTDTVATAAVDYGSLFGRDGSHREHSVLNPSSRRLLLQEVGIRFVNILISWAQCVKDLLFVEQPPHTILKCCDVTPHSLNTDFHLSDKSSSSNLKLRIADFMPNVDHCCSILQDEDVFIWFDYIFTLRETLRSIDIRLISASSIITADSCSGLTPDSSFPTDSYVSSVSNAHLHSSPFKKNSVGKTVKDIHCRDSTHVNGLIFCLETCFGLVGHLKKTHTLLLLHGDVSDDLFAKITENLFNRITILVNTFFEKLFHYMYDFNCKEYFILLDGTVQSFLTMYENDAADGDGGIGMTGQTADINDPNFDIIRQFIAEWNERYSQLFGDIRVVPTPSVARIEYSAGHSPVEVTDLSMPKSPSTTATAKSMDNAERNFSGGRDELNTHAPNPSAHLSMTNLIDNLIGDDKDLPFFSGSLSTPTAKVSNTLPVKDASANKNISDTHPESACTEMSDEFEYDLESHSPGTLGKRSLTSAAAEHLSSPTKSTVEIGANDSVCNPPLASDLAQLATFGNDVGDSTTTTLCSPNKKQKREYINNTTTEVGSMSVSSVPTSTSCIVSLSELHESAKMLKHVNCLVSAWKNSTVIGHEDIRGGSRKEIRHLLTKNTLLAVQVVENMVQLTHSLDDDDGN